MQRIGLICPSLSQCIIEMWHASEEFEPRYPENWKELNMVYVREVTYHGQAVCGDRDVHVFRQGVSTTETRMVWISGPAFWVDPIETPDDEALFVPDLNRCGKGEGILKMSPGSFIGKYWDKIYKIHSTDEFSINLSQEYPFKKLESLGKKLMDILRFSQSGSCDENDKRILFNR